MNLEFDEWYGGDQQRVQSYRQCGGWKDSYFYIQFRDAINVNKVTKLWTLSVPPLAPHPTSTDT